MSSSVILRKIASLLLVTWIGTGFAQDKKEPAWANLPDFSATEVRGSLHWKIHHSGAKLRVDPSPAAATIWAPEEDKVYNLLLLREKTTCIVMKTADAKMMRSPFQVAYGPNTVRTATTEKKTLDGHICTVLDGVTTLPDGKIDSKIWTADDLKGVPLRIDLYSDIGTVTASYRDVVVGTPEANLFALPGKCIPPDKTYQLAPGSAPIPNKTSTEQKGPDRKP
jgi:hypothetical protein